MTNLIRIIEDPDEAEAARQGAAFEFLDEMDRDPEAGRDISRSMIDRWYGFYPPTKAEEPGLDAYRDREDLWERRIP